MGDLLTSERLTLRPSAPNEKRKIFDWLANSNLTSQMLGPPVFPDNPVPTWEEFDHDYSDHFFDGTQPLMGRCFIIIHKGQEIGQINYNEIDSMTNATELDIWLADKQFTGQGFGPEAVKILCRYLDKRFSCKRIYMQPSLRNPNAIRAYKKAGFKEQLVVPGNFVLDYYDSVLLEMQIDNIKNTSS